MMEINHGKLDIFLGKVLKLHKSGEVSLVSAIGTIAHVIAAVEKDNETEVQSWLDNEDLESWLKRD